MTTDEIRQYSRDLVRAMPEHLHRDLAALPADQLDALLDRAYTRALAIRAAAAHTADLMRAELLPLVWGMARQATGMNPQQV